VDVLTIDNMSKNILRNNLWFNSAYGLLQSLLSSMYL